MTATLHGVRLESVSIGKGYVTWRVQFPPLARRRRQIAREYPKLHEACQALKTWCRRDECAPETAELVEKTIPSGEWGSGLTGSSSNG